jgi:hypothetical protein
MGKLKDLSGNKFGRLTVISDTGERPWGNVLWSCKCDCGNIVNVQSQSLVSGLTKSCGCLRKEVLTGNQHAIIHGLIHTPEYRVWISMIQRCTNSNNDDYCNYGGRGITVCNS